MSLGNDNEENNSDARNQIASHESEISSSTPFSGFMILLGNPILLFVGQDSYTAIARFYVYMIFFLN
jgi:hypothetical protein